MFVTESRSHAPQKNRDSDCNGYEWCKWLLYINSLPQARHWKTQTDQNPESLNWNTVNLTDSLHA